MAVVSGIFSKRRFILGGAAAVWLLFAASFLMPVMQDANMLGWQAFWFYLSKTLDPVDFWRHVQTDPVDALVVTFTSTNGSMLLAPVLLWRGSRWSAWLGFFLVLGGLVPCVAFHEMVVKNELRCGFYCWVGSIFLMAGAGFWNWLWYRRQAGRR